MAANIELNQTETELKREWKASSGNKKDGVNNLLPTVGDIMTASCEMKGETEVQKRVSVIWRSGSGEWAQQANLLNSQK